jgi:hypothetical protein
MHASEARAFNHSATSPRQKHTLALAGQLRFAGGVQILGLPGGGGVLESGGLEADMAKAEPVQVLTIDTPCDYPLAGIHKPAEFAI